MIAIMAMCGHHHHCHVWPLSPLLSARLPRCAALCIRIAEAILTSSASPLKQARLGAFLDLSGLPALPFQLLSVMFGSAAGTLVVLASKPNCHRRRLQSGTLSDLALLNASYANLFPNPSTLNPRPQVLNTSQAHHQNSLKP